MDNSNEGVIKIVITGDSGVGKTNLITRYVYGSFNEFSNPTVGLDFALKNTIVAGQNISCQIWDTAGQEKMKSIASAYYKNANGAVLVFDISNKSSFNRLSYWLSEIRDNLNDQEVNIVLLGNKCDLIDKREVALEEAKAFAEQNGFYYLEVSAKSNDNECVNLAFDQLLGEIHSKMQLKTVENEKETSLAQQDKSHKINVSMLNETESLTKKKGCC